MEKEIWFDIPVFEELYQFSNLLRLKNIKTGKIKKPILMKNGYYIYSLWEHNKEHKKYIHDLVLAHVLAGPKAKHDKWFQKKCKEIGLTDEKYIRTDI